MMGPRRGEHHMEMSGTRCLLLAGPSSAGKSSLAREFELAAPEPWFFFEADLMSGGFPRGRPEFVTLAWDRRVRSSLCTSSWPSEVQDTLRDAVVQGAVPVLSAGNRG